MSSEIHHAERAALRDRHEHIPGFKAVGGTVGVLYIVLGVWTLLRGVRDVMQPFGVPDALLGSPHYADYFHFTFVHMVVLGVMTGMLGWFVRDARSQRWVALAMCSIGVHYTYLDVRTSDSWLGNRLYQGPATLIPVGIDIVVTVAWGYLALRRTAVRTSGG